MRQDGFPAACLSKASPGVPSLASGRHQNPPPSSLYHPLPLAIPVPFPPNNMAKIILFTLRSPWPTSLSLG